LILCGFFARIARAREEKGKKIVLFCARIDPPTPCAVEGSAPYPLAGICGNPPPCFSAS